MAANDNFARLVEEHRNLLRQFALTELDLAITFCERALTAAQPQKGGRSVVQKDTRSRNLNNARKAYRSALWAMKRSEENVEKDSAIAERIRKIKPMLAALKRA